MKVLIMAQGQQTRLAGAITCPKQWVHLPYPHGAPQRYAAAAPGTIGQEPIIARTIRQLREIGAHHVTVVATRELADLMGITDPARVDGWIQRSGLNLHVVINNEPGNNLLAGLRQMLDREPYQTECTVLLGDVVYSWHTLRVLLRRMLGKNNPRPDPFKLPFWPPVTFAGTPVVTASSGEIWGCSWDIDGLDAVMGALGRIKDPPFEEYQCGQLRKLLWEIQKLEVLPIGEVPPNPFTACTTGAWYHPTDDYTADIDTPADLAKLPQLGAAAYADDQRELEQARGG